MLEYDTALMSACLLHDFRQPSSPHIKDYWKPISSPVGPYLRIDHISPLKDNFYTEYNITATEGLQAYMTGTSTCHYTFFGLTFLLILITTVCR